MKVVNLYDLKQMGNKGGCTIQLIHHFPFGMGLGHLKKDYIEFKRVGIFDGKAVEVTLREPYSRDLLQVVKSIKQRHRKRASFLLEFQNGRSRILPLLGIVFCQSLNRDKPATSSQSLVEKKHLIFQ